MVDRGRSLEVIQNVSEPVSRYTRRTPLLRSQWLSEITGADVYLKCENLQLTGSFKVRGAVAAMSCLSEADRRDGVVACSRGRQGEREAGARSTVTPH